MCNIYSKNNNNQNYIFSLMKNPLFSNVNSSVQKITEPLNFNKLYKANNQQNALSKDDKDLPSLPKEEEIKVDKKTILTKTKNIVQNHENKDNNEVNSQFKYRQPEVPIDAKKPTTSMERLDKLVMQKSHSCSKFSKLIKPLKENKKYHIKEKVLLIL